MARRTFDVIDVTEILVHWHAGRSKNEMAASLGVDRKTLRKYIAPAEAAGITPGGPPKGEEEWAELVRGWFPRLADTRLRQVTWPAIAPSPSGPRTTANMTIRPGPGELPEQHPWGIS
jgi:hypothetical protein